MEDVLVSLSSDEALVLLELLHRWEDRTSIDTALLPGEQVALWNLSCSLERVLAEPFSADYADKVTGARTRLAGR
jgi:hypothetical protein